MVFTDNKIKQWLQNREVLSTLCSVSVALSLNTIYRLPSEAYRYDAGPFAIAHLMVAAVIAVPLCYLELSLGKFCEEGPVRIWRAVPILRGIGYIKLLASFLISSVGVIHVSLSLSYLIWLAKGPIPMLECRDIHMTPEGYVNRAVGMECLRRTFLTPMTGESMWYGVVGSIIFITWFVISLCLYCLEKSLKCAILLMASIILFIFVALLAAVGEDPFAGSQTMDWSVLSRPGIWYAALVQTLYTSFIGTGFLHAAGGTVYSRDHNIFRTTIIYVVCCNLFGWVALLVWSSTAAGAVKEMQPVMILLMIYDSAVVRDLEPVWPILGFVVVVLAGCISVMILLYPIFMSLKLDSEDKWRLAALGPIIGGIIGSLLIFSRGLDFVVLLDKYLVPIILVFVILVQIFTFVFIYGWKALYKDLEFLNCEPVSIFWCISWLVASTVVLGLPIWRLVDIAMAGWPWPYQEWAFWVCVAILIACVLIIIGTAFYMIQHQEEYDFFSKLKSSFKPSSKWGPSKPRTRHIWILWKTSSCATYQEFTKVYAPNALQRTLSVYSTYLDSQLLTTGSYRQDLADHTMKKHDSVMMRQSGAGEILTRGSSTPRTRSSLEGAARSRESIEMGEWDETLAHPDTRSDNSIIGVTTNTRIYSMKELNMPAYMTTSTSF